MSSRLSIVALSLSLGFGIPASAKDAPKKSVVSKPGTKSASSRTWKILVDHMLAKGSTDYIKAPSSRTLGFESDKVETKGLYLKSQDSRDGREHSFEVVCEVADKKVAQKPREIVLGRIRVTEKNSIKEINSNRLRLTLDGSPIQGMHASGIVGKVKQVPMSGDSEETKEFLSDEREFWLKEVDLAKLVQ